MKTRDGKKYALIEDLEIRLLSPEGERFLWEVMQRNKQGGRAWTKARDIFVHRNMPLALKIARDYAKWMELDDAFQHGCRGLLRAAVKYDGSLGWRFSTYAGWWIKQSIRRGIADERGTIRVPVEADFKDRRGNLSESVKAAVHAARSTTSLDVIESDYRWIADHREATPDDSLDLADGVDRVAFLMSQISESEREVIRLRFGFGGAAPLTMRDTGKVIGISGERVRQIENRAMHRLKIAASRGKMEASA